MIDTKELIIDVFAGGGGASEGIERALGRPVDIAINHDENAIEMHRANHPKTLHLTEDVWKQAPKNVTKGRPVGLLWLSPDCKHFSRAKGSKPVDKNIRSLAWVAIKWAQQCKPRIIFLENVREFAEWSPIVPRWVCESCNWKGTEGQATLVRRSHRCPRCESKKLRVTEDLIPDPKRLGLTFRRFVGRLNGLGYKVEWRVLNAADYGAPTHRCRLFLVARCDGQPIEWPDSTHGDPKKIDVDNEDLFGKQLKPWRTAAECINWDVPCPSIFDRKLDLLNKRCRKKPCKGKYVAHRSGKVKCQKCSHVSKRVIDRPLADKTMRRIALGIKRYVLENPKPFIVRYNDEKTPTTANVHGVDEPINTIPTENRFGIVSPHIVRFRGDAESGAVDPQQPLPTITAGSFVKRPAGAGHALGVATPVLIPVTHHGERRANSPDEPLPTVTGANRGEIAVAVPELAPVPKQFVHRCGQVNVLSTSRAKCRKCGKKPWLYVPKDRTLASPLLVRGCQNGSNGKCCNSVTEPLTTIVSKNEHMVVSPVLIGAGGAGYAGKPKPLDEPANTVMTNDRRALAVAFIAKHFGGMVGVAVDTPLPTSTAKGCQNQAVAATLLQFNHEDAGIAKSHHGVVSANLIHLNRHTNPTSPGDPVPTVTVTTQTNKLALVYSFLTRYNGTGIGAHLTEPLFTSTGKDRFGLVFVMVEGEPYVIVDIGMRMLSPRELATAQGFRKSYILTGTKTSQVARIGNSVSPEPAEALVSANFMGVLAA